MAARRLACVLVLTLAAASSWLDAYEDKGYFVLPRVFSGTRLAKLRGAVARFLKEQGSAHAYMMRGATLGGWFVPGIERLDGLRGFETEIARDDRLARILRKLLGDDFKLLERSEIYVSRIGNWHSDDLYDAFDLYATTLPYVTEEWCPSTGVKRPPPLAKPNNSPMPKDDDELCAMGLEYGFGKGTTFWAGAGTPQERKVTTVAVYLEDHVDNDGGLSIAPGSHRNASVHGDVVARLDPWNPLHRPEAETLFDLVRSHAGDAVVFDARLVHRGPRDAVADFKRELSKNRRTVATFSFGRNNAVSEAFSRGMRFRTDMLLNGSICNGQRDKNGDPDFGGACAFAAVREDLVRRPLRGAPDGAPFLEVRADLAKRRWR